MPTTPSQTHPKSQPPRNRHETQRMLVLSTSHLCYETSKILDAFTGEVGWGSPIAYGYLVRAFTDASQELPDEVRQAALLAQRLGCHYLRYDRDGETYPELPSFEW